MIPCGDCARFRDGCDGESVKICPRQLPLLKMADLFSVKFADGSIFREREKSWITKAEVFYGDAVSIKPSIAIYKDPLTEVFEVVFMGEDAYFALGSFNCFSKAKSFQRSVGRLSFGQFISCIDEEDG